MITIIGPTASGKTTFAAHLAATLGAEIISGDSRQVYRGMDLGTGKDLADYTVGPTTVPHHLIDIASAGEKYSVYRFQHDFLAAYRDITARGRLPILCGGSGLYVESVLRGYRMSEVPQNPRLRASLAGKSLDELAAVLATFRTLHNTNDTDNRQRAIRAIEINQWYADHPGSEFDNDAAARADLDHIRATTTVIGLAIPRDERRERITARLRQRLDEGMLDEIRRLLDQGVAADDLIYYGLEYKYLTLHVLGRLTYDEMFTQLETAIHQFAKRQMTWFRGMERRGTPIHWIDALQPMDEKILQARALCHI